MDHVLKSLTGYDSSINSKISEIQNQMNQMMNRISDLEEENKNQKKTIQELQNQISNSNKNDTYEGSHDSSDHTYDPDVKDSCSHDEKKITIKVDKDQKTVTCIYGISSCCRSFPELFEQKAIEYDSDFSESGVQKIICKYDKEPIITESDDKICFQYDVRYDSAYKFVVKFDKNWFFYLDTECHSKKKLDIKIKVSGENVQFVNEFKSFNTTFLYLLHKENNLVKSNLKMEQIKFILQHMNPTKIEEKNKDIMISYRIKVLSMKNIIDLRIPIHLFKYEYTSLFFNTLCFNDKFKFLFLIIEESHKQHNQNCFYLRKSEVTPNIITSEDTDFSGRKFSCRASNYCIQFSIDKSFYDFLSSKLRNINQMFLLNNKCYISQKVPFFSRYEIFDDKLLINIFFEREYPFEQKTFICSINVDGNYKSKEKLIAVHSKSSHLRDFSIAHTEIINKKLFFVIVVVQKDMGPNQRGQLIKYNDKIFNYDYDDPLMLYNIDKQVLLQYTSKNERVQDSSSCHHIVDFLYPVTN